MALPVRGNAIQVCPPTLPVCRNILPPSRKTLQACWLNQQVCRPPLPASWKNVQVCRQAPQASGKPLQFSTADWPASWAALAGVGKPRSATMSSSTSRSRPRIRGALMSFATGCTWSATESPSFSERLFKATSQRFLFFWHCLAVICTCVVRTNKCLAPAAVITPSA